MYTFSEKGRMFEELMTRCGGVEVAGWIVEREIRVRLPA